MATQINFRELVEEILNRYRQTSLIERWREAIQLEPDPKPIAYWIRESEDLVNIVWLMRHDVRDITWYPTKGMSTFNILRYPAIAGFEVREASKVAESFGLGIVGNYLVHVHSYAERGGLFWVASNEEEEVTLTRLLGQLMELLEES